MRKLENMGSIFIIPGKEPKNVETDDGFIDYDLDIGNLETNRKCNEDGRSCEVIVGEYLAVRQNRYDKHRNRDGETNRYRVFNNVLREAVLDAIGVVF